MARHTGTCQHTSHPLDAHRRESRKSTGPVRIGPTRAPGFIEMENTKATPEQNATVRPCLRCTIPVKRARMSAEEAKHWPNRGPSQMQAAFNRAFYAYGVNNGIRGYSSQEGRELWNVRRCSTRRERAA
jgi:hypothetical protein